MSQKEEMNPEKASDKWRDMAEREAFEEVEIPSSADEQHDIEGSAHKAMDSLSILEKQVEFYKDQAARGQAELENVRRRMDQEVSKARKFGVERLVSDLVPVVDGLEQGLEGSAASTDSAVLSMRKGMEMTLDLLTKLLEKNGIEVITPKMGDAFDPMMHEAMSMRPDPDAAPNTVLQVLRKGYALHGRVIRAAMVIVAG